MLNSKIACVYIDSFFFLPPLLASKNKNKYTHTHIHKKEFLFYKASNHRRRRLRQRDPIDLLNSFGVVVILNRLCFLLISVPLSCVSVDSHPHRRQSRLNRRPQAHPNLQSVSIHPRCVLLLFHTREKKKNLHVTGHCHDTLQILQVRIPTLLGESLWQAY